ncbi:MAG: hypothetical protein OJF50_006406 [Nitrospira sp.]|jgi:hypothetical protein|nr:hypothetical protein [Nitrospira sp.]
MTNRLRRDAGACARWPMLLNPPETVIDDGVKLRVAQRLVHVTVTERVFVPRE